jgi:hypothetical protein
MPQPITSMTWGLAVSVSGGYRHDTANPSIEAEYSLNAANIASTPERFRAFVHGEARTNAVEAVREPIIWTAAEWTTTRRLQEALVGTSATSAASQLCAGPQKDDRHQTRCGIS